MQTTSHSAVWVLAIAGTLALAGCKKPEEAAVTPPPAAEPAAPAPAPMEPAAMPASVSVTALTIGNTAAEDKSVAPVATLAGTDKIIVSIKTDGIASAVPVSAKLTYQDGQVAGEQAATLNTTGPETTNIEFSNANPWPPGTYTAEVSVSGKPVGQQQFEIK